MLLQQQCVCVHAAMTRSLVFVAESETKARLLLGATGRWRAKQTRYGLAWHGLKDTNTSDKQTYIYRYS
jgi:hypothetical protein